MLKLRPRSTSKPISPSTPGDTFAQITQIVQHHRQKRYSYWPELKIGDLRQVLREHMIEIDDAHRPPRNGFSRFQVRPQYAMGCARIQNQLEMPLRSNPPFHNDQITVA